MNPVSNIDDSFGFSSDFYQDLCIFNDASINGQTYRLYLNVLPGETDPETYGYTYSDVKAYRVEVLHLTPELYRFLAVHQRRREQRPGSARPRANPADVVECPWRFRTDCGMERLAVKLRQFE